MFWAFFKIAISGFGGALPWTRRMFVEQKAWMTPQEFNDAYALCQFLPGPNIVNLAAVFGARMRGATGALAAWLGFLGPPFVIMSTVGVLYARYGDAETLRKILGGLAAAAAGLMIATFVRMAEPLFRLRAAATSEQGGVRSLGAQLGARLTPQPFVMLAVVAAIGLFRWPLLWVMAVVVPASILLTWWRR
ncbi:MAG TPA: chromate transporter [Xanthobacteraceae bacterium]|nr:chromate transporter [Xanthobacteraceae bacterium]